MNRKAGFALALACCLAGSAGRARAEVGIATTGPLHVPYVMAQITDDSDPWGGAWKRYGVDLNRQVLNPEGFDNGDGEPTLLSLPDGRVLVAWARNSAQGFDVVWSVWAFGAWSAPAVVAGSPGEGELHPSVAQAPDGTIHLVYTVADGAETKVVHRQAPSDLSAWSAETQVSPVGQDARRPSAVWDGQALRVAYEIHDFGVGQTPRSIAVSRLDAGGFVTDIVAVTYGTDEIVPRLHRDAGRVWIDWVDATGEVAWTRLDAQGQWESLRYETFENQADGEFHVRPGLRTSAVLP